MECKAWSVRENGEWGVLIVCGGVGCRRLWIEVGSREFRLWIVKYRVWNVKCDATVHLRF